MASDSVQQREVREIVANWSDWTIHPDHPFRRADSLEEAMRIAEGVGLKYSDIWPIMYCVNPRTEDVDMWRRCLVEDPNLTEEMATAIAHQGIVGVMRGPMEEVAQAIYQRFPRVFVRQLPRDQRIRTLPDVTWYLATMTMGEAAERLNRGDRSAEVAFALRGLFSFDVDREPVETDDPWTCLVMGGTLNNPAQDAFSTFVDHLVRHTWSTPLDVQDFICGLECQAAILSHADVDITPLKALAWDMLVNDRVTPAFAHAVYHLTPFSFMWPVGSSSLTILKNLLQQGRTIPRIWGPQALVYLRNEHPTPSDAVGLLTALDRTQLTQDDVASLARVLRPAIRNMRIFNYLLTMMEFGDNLFLLAPLYLELITASTQMRPRYRYDWVRTPMKWNPTKVGQAMAVARFCRCENLMHLLLVGLIQHRELVTEAQWAELEELVRAPHFSPHLRNHVRL